MSTQEIRLAILHRIISKSDDVGKTQLQKLGYFLQEALDVPMGYSFRMYHYGPYGDALETDVSRLKLTGYIDIEPDSQGYGFHINSKDESLDEWRVLAEPYEEKIDSVIETFGGSPAYELELAATIHFVRKLLPDVPPEEVITRVKSLKPRFDEAYIRCRHSELERLGFLRQT